jgi:alkylation response protein AidB-like acyl-CoA dehydrogenase
VTMTDRPTTSTDVLGAAEALAPQIAARAAEVEQARRLPADLLQSLVDGGCFRLLLPGTHGGLGADLPRALQVLEVLARADGSVGWTVMIGSGSWCDLAALPRATFDALYADGPDAIAAGAFNPSGQAEAVDGGYRITGRWAFASGCQHARWVFGNCVEGVVVPAERTCAPLVDEHGVDAPVVRIPAPSFFALGVAGVALGIAQGALDDITALAASRVPLLAGGPLATDPTFQARLAEADTDVAAARALLHDTATSVWATAVAGTEPTLEERARTRAAAVWVAEHAAAVVEAAYLAGGSAALYASCPLQRRLRDISTLRQHFLVRADTLATAGALLAGQELTVPVF